MKMVKIVGVLAVTSAALPGCATITPEAASVQVHTQISSLLTDCKRLGNVSATVNAWTKGTLEAVYQQAKNDVRDKAYRDFGADTVAIVNSDYIGTDLTTQAVAFKCNK